WMYISNDFLFKIKEILNLKLEDTTIEEVKTVYRAKSHEFDDEAIGNWICDKYSCQLLMTIEEKEKDRGIDYLAYYDKLSNGFAVYKARGSRYTSLLKPLQEILNRKEEIFSLNAINFLSQILVCRDKTQAENI